MDAILCSLSDTFLNWPGSNVVLPLMGTCGVRVTIRTVLHGCVPNSRARSSWSRMTG